jgi:large subunit ribosomal protein L29
VDAKELRLKTDDELSDQLLVLRKEAFNLRFRAASGQLENTARVREVRRTIARVKTIIRQRKQAAPAGAEQGSHAEA